jgi:hypothetical protein
MKRSPARDDSLPCFQIGNLAGDEFPASSRERQPRHKILELVANCLTNRGENLKCHSEQSVSCQHRNAFAEDLVRGRAAAAEVIVIHAGQIVVDQRVSVNAFDGRGRGQRVISASSASLGGRDAKHRSHALPSGEQTVAHCPMNSGRLCGSFWQQAIQAESTSLTHSRRFQAACPTRAVFRLS